MKIHFENKRILILFLIFVVVAGFAIGLLSQSGSAQEELQPIPPPPLETNDPLHHIPGLSGLQSPLAITIEIMLALAGVLAFVAIVYSGLMYIMSGGDPEKSEVAKKNLVWAIIGIVIILLSFIVIHWITDILSAGSF